MPEAFAIVSLGLFVALAVTFLYVLRRAARVVAVTREDEGFRKSAAGLADRAAATIAEGAAFIDRVRRRQDGPASLDDVLPALLEALAEHRAEVERLAAPAVLAQLHARLAEELDRATRAVEVVDHGRALLAITSGRVREAEGETSVKRGYLNLLHAREALVSLAIDLRAGRTDATRWYSDRVSAEE